MFNAIGLEDFLSGLTFVVMPIFFVFFLVLSKFLLKKSWSVSIGCGIAGLVIGYICTPILFNFWLAINGMSI